MSANRTYHERYFPTTSIYQRKSISLYPKLLSLEIRGHTVQHDLNEYYSIVLTQLHVLIFKNTLLFTAAKQAFLVLIYLVICMSMPILL
jgi:hypothetical protein